jgi:hypothetical protein
MTHALFTGIIFNAGVILSAAKDLQFFCQISPPNRVPHA